MRISVCPGEMLIGARHHATRPITRKDLPTLIIMPPASRLEFMSACHCRLRQTAHLLDAMVIESPEDTGREPELEASVLRGS